MKLVATRVGNWIVREDNGQIFFLSIYAIRIWNYVKILSKQKLTQK